MAGMGERSARCRRRPRQGAGGAPTQTPLGGSRLRRACPCSKAGRRQAQGNDNYRVPFGKLRRRSVIPAGSMPLSCAPCNGDYRPFDKLRRRTLNGPDQEVYFPPGASSGPRGPAGLHPLQLPGSHHRRPYRHLLFHLVLRHSGWRYTEVATGEIFLALKQRLQNAFWELGGAPRAVLARPSRRRAIRTSPEPTATADTG